MTQAPDKIKTLDILTQDGKKANSIELNQKLFDGSVNQALLHEAIVMYQANARTGNASAKTRAEVRGGGKKPWRQKGTGRARAGSIRSPLWRGGGVIFAPKPRDYYYRLPKKALKGALRSALNDKINENGIIILDKIELASHKTKDLLNILKGLKLSVGNQRVLLIAVSITDNLRRASNNLRKVCVMRSSDVNAQDIILAKKIIVEKKAFLDLEKRIKI
jgi:large subunit ribosomal protein L4